MPKTLLTNRARAMRKAMTEPDVMLWSRLRGRDGDRPIFRRQQPIGPFIADFYCAAARLVVEVDGSTHWDEAGQARDEARDRWMTREGITVHRIPASSIFRDLSEVAYDVIRHADALIEAQRQCVGPSLSTTRSTARC